MAACLARIVTEKTLCHSKAFGFVIDGFSRLLAAGHVEAELPFSNQSQVTYGMTAQGEVIAASVHYYDAGKRAFWLQFSTVAEAHRRRGAYRELFEEVKELARRAGAVNLYAGIATDNDAMLQTARQLKREPVMVRYRYPLNE
jgi:predicted GNAT family acetyltransferase